MNQDPTAAVVALLRRVLNHSEVSEGAELGLTKGWTSLAHVRVIAELEKEFRVRVRAAQVARLVSVSLIVAFVRENCRCS